MAGEAPIKIRVGASKDASIDRMFAQVEARARTAGRVVAQSLNNAFKGMGRQPAARGRQADPFAYVPAAARRAYGQAAKEARKASFDSEKYWTKATRNAAKESEREWNRAMKAAGRANRVAMRNMDRFVTRTSHRATRFFWPNMPITHVARRAMGDILRGAGVETHLAGIVGRLTRSEELATAVTTQAYRPGETGFAGRRFSAAKLQEEARGVGQEFAFATEQILAGQKAFVDLEGDLEAARMITKDMASLAKSQNVDFAETMHTAAKANQMFSTMPEYAGDVQKRFAAVNDLMHRLVYQGKVGSITMEYMAKNFAKLSGMTALFESAPTKVALQMTTLAQMAEAGAAKSPAQATQWINMFARQLDRPQTRQKFMEVMGIDIRSKKTGRLLDPFSIIEATMMASAGGGKIHVPGFKGKREVSQQEMIGAALRGRGTALLGGFMKAQEVWIRATKGEATPEAITRGRGALRSFFGRYGETVSAKQEAQDLAERMKTAASKAEKFNQQVEKVVASAATKLVPALEKLAPAALSAAKVLGWLAKFAVEHPVIAGGGALGAVTMRAFGESWFRYLVEKTLLTRTLAQFAPGGIRAAGAAGGAGGVGGVVYAGRKRAAAAAGVAGTAGAAARGGGFMAMPTIGGGVMAGVTGLAVGATVASAIYAGGIASFESSAERYAELTKSIADVTGKELGPALIDFEAKLKKLKESEGWTGAFFDFFGAGTEAERKGAEELLERKRAEYRQDVRNRRAERRELYTGRATGTPAEQAEKLTKLFFPEHGKPQETTGQVIARSGQETVGVLAKIQAQLATGVRVTNPEEFKLTPGEEPPPRPRPGLEPTG